MFIYFKDITGRMNLKLTECINFTIKSLNASFQYYVILVIRNVRDIAIPYDNVQLKYKTVSLKYDANLYVQATETSF